MLGFALGAQWISFPLHSLGNRGPVSLGFLDQPLPFLPLAWFPIGCFNSSTSHRCCFTHPPETCLSLTTRGRVRAQWSFSLHLSSLFCQVLAFPHHSRELSLYNVRPTLLPPHLCSQDSKAQFLSVLLSHGCWAPTATERYGKFCFLLWHMSIKKCANK